MRTERACGARTLEEVPPSILFVEDSVGDFELMLETLSRSRPAAHERVCTAEALETALAARAWDVAIVDYRLPAMSGLDAARIIAARQPGLPMILVSGCIEHARAIDAMRAGLRDYVPKDDLGRLDAAIAREVMSARRHRAAQRHALELELEARGHRELVAALVAALPEPLLVLDDERTVRDANPAFMTCAVAEPLEVIGRPVDLVLERAGFQLPGCASARSAPWSSTRAPRSAGSR